MPNVTTGQLERKGDGMSTAQLRKNLLLQRNTYSAKALYFKHPPELITPVLNF